MNRARAATAVLSVLAGSVIVSSWAAPAASATVTFTCVPKNINTCVVTIPLTSNMNEQVGSTMPDTHPWFNSEANGNGTVSAPYALSGPGAPDTFWDGVSGATQGHVWAAQLTTQSDEPAGGDAVLTFEHVTPITKPTPVPYKSVSVSGPLTATHGSRVTITSVVKPKPPAGHVILQRKKGTSWVKIASLTFSAKHHHWRVRFKWTAPKHATWKLRVLATATKTLKATPSGTIKVHTVG